jgi:hypothetical protein
MRMSKWASTDKWLVGPVRTLHEGFGGAIDSPCSQDLELLPDAEMHDEV